MGVQRNEGCAESRPVDDWLALGDATHEGRATEVGGGVYNTGTAASRYRVAAEERRGLHLNLDRSC